MKLPTALLCLCLAACASSDKYDSPEGAGDVPPALEQARLWLDEGRTADALELAQATRQIRGLDPELRNEVELLTEAAAHRRLDELSDGGHPKELEELMDMGLPRQLAVTAGVTAARRWFEEGKPKKTFKLVRKLDEKYPFHHERPAAGEILFDAGYDMSQGRKAIFDFLTLRDNGREALEYLCDTYVSDPRWDEACWRVAELYEEDLDFVIARQWHEDLLYFRPDSDLAPASRARIPHVRLLSVTSPEYDRTQVLLARGELERWLELYPDHELVPKVRRDLADALQRLWASDLLIADFYRRNHKPDGARLHAERARETAGLLDAPELVQEAEEFLAALAPVEERSEPPPEGDAGAAAGSDETEGEGR